MDSDDAGWLPGPDAPDVERYVLDPGGRAFLSVVLRNGLLEGLGSATVWAQVTAIDGAPVLDPLPLRLSVEVVPFWVLWHHDTLGG